MSFWTPTYLQIRNSQVKEYMFISTSRWQKGGKIPLNGKEFSFWAVTAAQGLIKRTLCAVFGPQWQRGGSQGAYGSYLEVFGGCQPSRSSARLAQKTGTGKLKFRCSKNKLHSTIISSSQPQSAFPPFLLISSFFLSKSLPFPSGILVKSLPSVHVAPHRPPQPRRTVTAYPSTCCLCLWI